MTTYLPSHFEQLNKRSSASEAPVPLKRKDRLYLLWIAILCIAMSLVTFSFIEMIARNDIERKKTISDRALLDSATLIAQDIQRNISYGIFSAELLSSALKANNYQVTNFEELGRLALARDSGTKIIQLAPGGIIRYSYPLHGNEDVIGVDLLKNERNNDGALKSLRSEKLTFVGPMKLMQSDEYAVIARKPIFHSVNGTREFWGFATAILFARDILPRQLSQLEQKGLLIKVEGNDPDLEENPIFYQSAGWREKDFIESKVDVPNGEWVLKIGYLQSDQTDHMILRIAAFCISIGFFSLLFWQQYSMRKKQRKIIYLNNRLKDLSMRDELTGIGNRRAGVGILKQQLEQSERYGCTFSIAMIDLDNFKKINDQHGHLAGDSMLQHIASSLVKSTRENDMVFRTGGDEFLIVYPHTSLKGGRSALNKTMDYLRASPCIFSSESLPVSLSAGLAEYQTGESVKMLLQRADAKLYESKAAGRDTLRW